MACTADEEEDIPNVDGYLGGAPTTKDEQLRAGTRQQYTSEWRLIVASASHAFTHGLGEVPWVCDVVESYGSDGAKPTTSSATVTKTDTTITVTNGGSNRVMSEAASSICLRSRSDTRCHRIRTSAVMAGRDLPLLM